MAFRFCERIKSEGIGVGLCRQSFVDACVVLSFLGALICAHDVVCLRGVAGQK